MGIKIYNLIGGIKITEDTFIQVANQLQKDLIDIIEEDIELDDYKVILYNYLFTKELDFPVLHIERDNNYFIIHVLPDDLSISDLASINEVFDRFNIMFLPNSENLIRLKFILKNDYMYSEEVKLNLMEESSIRHG